MIVKSRRLDVEIPKLPTVPAVALVFCSLKSRTLEAVPPIDTAPVKTLAWDEIFISVLATVASRVVVPVTVSTPNWVSAPPTVTVKFPVPSVPTSDVPRIISLISFTATGLLPVLFKLTAPLKLLAASSVITPAPALNVAAPALAACVILPF